MQKFNLDNFLPYTLSIASQSVSSLIAKAYESKFGLTMSQWRVLVIIKNHGPIYASEICERTLLDKMVVSRSVKALKQRKLIAANQSKNDARKTNLTISKTGTQIYEDIIPIAKAYEKKLISSLSDSQYRSLIATLESLIQSVTRITKDEN